MLTKSPLVRRLIAGLCLCSCFAWLPTEAEARSGHQRRHQRRTIRRVIRRVTAVDQLPPRQMPGFAAHQKIG